VLSTAADRHSMKAGKNRKPMMLPTTIAEREALVPVS